MNYISVTDEDGVQSTVAMPYGEFSPEVMGMLESFASSLGLALQYDETPPLYPHEVIGSPEDVRAWINGVALNMEH